MNKILVILLAGAGAGVGTGAGVGAGVGAEAVRRHQTEAVAPNLVDAAPHKALHSPTC